MKIAASGNKNYTITESHKEEGLFQPAEEIEFPTKEGKEARIPHIIHQIYTNEHVITKYAAYIKSFTEQNPKWQYRFWTYDTGRDFLQKFHPYLLTTYDAFGNNVKKADMLRYAVIYEFGGIYADLDVQNLRPLDIVTTKFACIIPLEPFEHSVFLYKMDFFATTAVLLCRPKHPFFQQLLTNLRGAAPQGGPVGTTGPLYMTNQLMIYNNLTVSDLKKEQVDTTSNTPYFYKGNRTNDDNDAIYIPNNQYFSDNVDSAYIGSDGSHSKCVRTLGTMSKRACAEFDRRKKLRFNKKFTFTIHYWDHLWGHSHSKIRSMKTVYIGDLVPKCTYYN